MHLQHHTNCFFPSPRNDLHVQRSTPHHGWAGITFSLRLAVSCYSFWSQGSRKSATSKKSREKVFIFRVNNQECARQSQFRALIPRNNGEERIDRESRQRCGEALQIFLLEPLFACLRPDLATFMHSHRKKKLSSKSANNKKLKTRDSNTKCIARRKRCEWIA